MTALVLVEHDNQIVRESTFSVLSAARRLGEPVDALVVGHQCRSVVDQLLPFVDRILVSDQPDFEHTLAESVAPLILSVASSCSHILAPATAWAKDILPRVAAKLDVAQISDVVDILDDRCYVRPIYAGNALMTVESKDAVQVITIRPTAFDPAEPKQQQAELVVLDYIVENKQSRFVREEKHSADRPELTAAKVVVSGGRGLQDEAGFSRLMAIADRLNAAIGASRAAVDSGFAPNDFQVGQTGQTVAPKLYIAVGISGAIQHLAGMKDSGIIVAMNKDPDAPIFQVADYGLVGDLKDLLPEWEAWLTENNY